MSTPIASSTWLGVSVDAVQAEPLAIPNPRRSSSVTSASPSTYRQENVSTWGSRSAGWPTTSTSGRAPTTAADPVDQGATGAGSTSARSATTAWSAAAAASAAGTFSKPEARSSTRSSPG